VGGHHSSANGGHPTDDQRSYRIIGINVVYPLVPREHREAPKHPSRHSYFIHIFTQNEPRHDDHELWAGDGISSYVGLSSVFGIYLRVAYINALIHVHRRRLFEVTLGTWGGAGGDPFPSRPCLLSPTLYPVRGFGPVSSPRGSGQSADHASAKRLLVHFDTETILYIFALQHTFGI